MNKVNEFFVYGDLWSVFELAMYFNLICLLAYLGVALILAVLALITNYKKIKTMSLIEQLLFYFWQPTMYIKEMKRKKK